MDVYQLKRACVSLCQGTSATCPQSKVRACSAHSAPRRPALSFCHSSFCARNSLTVRKRHSPAVNQPKRRSPQQTSAAVWFRQQAVSPGSVSASAAAAHAAAILSIPLWQHAAKSACIVVASLAVAVTVSRFLIVNSGKLEAGEVNLLFNSSALLSIFSRCLLGCQFGQLLCARQSSLLLLRLLLAVILADLLKGLFLILAKHAR